MKFIATIILLLITNLAYAGCEDQTPYGFPRALQTTTNLCRKSYVVEYLDHCKTPLLVIEHLTGAKVGGTVPREASFKSDLEVKNRATLKSYEGRKVAGYDIGHMAPAEDFRADAVAMKQSFLLTNTVPQNASVNRGVWRELEERTRGLAVRQGDIYVITGTVYSAEVSKFNDVCVPSKMFKVIIDTKLNQSVAYMIPNNSSAVGHKVKEFITTVSNIEKEAGIDLFPDLPVERTSMKTLIGPDLL